MNTRIRTLLLLALTFFCGLSLGLAAVEPYRIVINGNPSKIQPQQDKEVILVPLTVPVSGESEEWVVSFKRDDKARTVDVKMAASKAKLRGDQECYYCTGKGLCPNDYPAGSGQNYSGITENSCNGTGRCYHCSGTGRF